jgi:hypothetical protein
MAKPWHNFTPRKPTKAQVLAAQNWQRPLDAPAKVAPKRTRRKMENDELPEWAKPEKGKPE